MAAEQSPIEVRAAAGRQTWTMQVAPVNPIGPRTLPFLHERLTAAEADPSVAVVVLTSGLEAFSAGGDATWMAQVAAERGTEGFVEEFIATIDTFRELCLRIRRSRLLVIAALNGHTLAGGLELAAACDLRFAAADPALRIGVPEMQLFGQMPSGGGGVQFLARLMGPSRALQLILDGAPVDPERAFALGLVDRLCPPEGLLAEAEAFADAVAAKASPVAVAAAKRAVMSGAELPLYEALELDRSLHWDSVRRGDLGAAVAAFGKRFAQQEG